jgi:hypothetical protein
MVSLSGSAKAYYPAWIAPAFPALLTTELLWIMPIMSGVSDVSDPYHTLTLS